MEELKAMFRVCAHIKKDGIRCGSPALKGGNFCFQHIGGSIRELTRARSTYAGPRLDFLYPGTRQAIQHNLFVVAQALNDGRLDLSMANTYNRIFATCERNLRRFEAQFQKPGPEAELEPVPDESSNPEDAKQAMEGLVSGHNFRPAPAIPENGRAGTVPLSPSGNGEQKPASSVSSESPVVNPSPGDTGAPHHSPTIGWESPASPQPFRSEPECAASSHSAP
jgi:hypothetical protein